MKMTVAGNPVRRRAVHGCLALCIALCATAAVAKEVESPHAAVDRAFDQAFERYQLPGLALGVIEDGKVVHIRTAGELRAGQGEPVNADTLFKIASTTKAMTTAVLARLVDQGKLRWDDPVIKHLPEFRMQDPWVTQNMQVRDLLIHNSGLRPFAGDLMLWPEPNHFGRDDIIAGLAHLKPAQSFRANYAYDNLLYVVAGKVAEQAGGKPYAELVREHLFVPLGMDRCQVGSWQRDAVGNIAQPHIRQGDANVLVREDGEQIPDTPLMAAGGVRCSVKDMLTWMQAWLVPESHPGWLSEKQRREVWTLQVPMPMSARMREWDNSHFSGYGYGWRLSDVDGQWKVAHTGTLMGMYTSLVLLPDKRNGFILMTNGEAEDARTTLTQALVKHYTAPGQGLGVDHYATLIEQARQPVATGGSTKPKQAAARVATPGELKQWQGVYQDPWFGKVRLCPAEDKVVFASAMSPKMTGTVMRVQDRWRVDWHAVDVGPAPFLEFTAGAADSVGVQLSYRDNDGKPGSDYADLELTRVNGCE